MSCSAFLPLCAGATAPEALSLLHRHLLQAEEEAEGLVRDLGSLGVSRDRILGSAEIMDATDNPLMMQWVQGDESTLWQQCSSLVNRVCRMESLLQTLKLTIFRLETERELDPSHTAHLKQQVAALQQESDEEQQARRREVMKLRDQLQQAYQERDEARTEVQRLWETVKAASAAKEDVALAAEELKTVKLEMSQKIMEMKEQMSQESAHAAEATKSHSELLQRFEEMERVAEMRRRQGLLLQSDCQVLRAEVQTSRQQLEEEKDRGRHLEEQCQQLKGQTAIKDSLVFELKTELESVHVALQRQQTENSRLLKEGREMRAAADRVQAERSRLVKQLQEHDVLLEAAGCSIHTDLQVALTDKVSLQKELEKIKGEHAHLLQRFSTAQDMAAAQRELLERTVERLQWELSMVQKEEGAMRKDPKSSKNEHKVQEADQMLKDLTLEKKPSYGATIRLHAQREIRKHQVEVEKLQELLTSAQSKHNRVLESLQKALDTVKVDNKRLANSLRQAVLTNSSLHSKLKQGRDQYQAMIALRDEELFEARVKISHLSDELAAVKQQSREDNESPMKTLHREISELKMTVKDSSTRSYDLSKANQELHQQVSELERQVCKQKACIRVQRSRLRQQEKSRDLHGSSPRVERLEESAGNLHEKDSKQVLSERGAEWERWTSTIQRWEARRELAHITGGYEPVRTQLKTQSH